MPDRTYWKEFEGQSVDSYHLKELLGNGAFGGVFRAEQVIKERPIRQVAIKLILPRSEECEHELRELEAAATLNHNHLARCFHFGLTSLLRTKLVFIVMELAQKSLRDTLATVQFSASEILDLADQLSSALAFLHAQRFSMAGNTNGGSVCVHRDIKPENILSVEGAWKLGDFGLVRAIPGAQSAIQTIWPAGTPRYMPPESFEGTISPAWDLWSLGCLLLEAAVSARPWHGVPDDELISAIRNGRPQIPGNLPRPIGEIIRGCLVSDYHQRMSAAQVVELIRAHREAEKQRQAWSGETADIARIKVVSIEGNTSREWDKYRFRVRIEAENNSSVMLGWSGLTINVPTLNSGDLYLATQVQMSAMGCDPPAKHGPGDEIWSFLEDGTFGRKPSRYLMVEAVREWWPRQERIALESTILAPMSRLDVLLRVWSNRPPSKTGDGFGDPEWGTKGIRDQQGFPAYPLSIGFD